MSGMQIVIGTPPNYDEIVARFGPLPDGTVFAWGDKLYAPGTTYKDISGDLLVHEMVHRRQQEDAGGPEAWWARYLDDDQFRLEQEVEAYRAQIASLPSREHRRWAKRTFAKTLASSMYGHVISEPAARAALSMAKVVAPT